VDAVDNGIERYESASPAKYIESTSLGARVGRLNPTWTDSDPDEWVRMRCLFLHTDSEG
jgi:uncharacterized UPF0160 family protein